MHELRTAQKTDNTQSAQVTVMPNLLCSILFYSKNFIGFTRRWKGRTENIAVISFLLKQIFTKNGQLIWHIPHQTT